MLSIKPAKAAVKKVCYTLVLGTPADATIGLQQLPCGYPGVTPRFFLGKASEGRVLERREGYLA